MHATRFGRNLLLIAAAGGLALCGQWGQGKPADRLVANRGRATTSTNSATEAGPAPEPEPITHAAVGARVEVSSTHTGEPGEAPPTALVDGDLATRWSSDYAAPQHIVVTLPKPLAGEAVVLHWENACARRYALAVSSDGDRWRPVHLYLNASVEPVPRRDTVPLRGATIKALKMDLLERVEDTWGFSLYEIELRPVRQH